ncbi:hypothetical protein N7486_005412 [Penicillium sp. IBT 16267x]|nr:hypothetical protein N7486_005412 [Penicillium sp. IBT 16267x]
MSKVIRRFIFYVGRVKLSDFKDESHMALVDKYCNDQETRFLDADGKRVGTGHLHEDGTSKFRYKQKPPSESRSGGFE